MGQMGTNTALFGGLNGQTRPLGCSRFVALVNSTARHPPIEPGGPASR